MNDFGESIKLLRIDKQLSIEELALKLNNEYEMNISKSMISRYENGVSEPKLNTVRILAEFFNVSLDHLLGLKDREKELSDGEYLKVIMESKGYDPTTLANDSGVPYSTICSMIENNFIQSYVNDVIKICRVLQIKVEDISDRS